MKQLKSALLTEVALPVASSGQERSNIIYIMADQQSATVMSCAEKQSPFTNRK